MSALLCKESPRKFPWKLDSVISFVGGFIIVLHMSTCSFIMVSTATNYGNLHILNDICCSIWALLYPTLQFPDCTLTNATCIHSVAFEWLWPPCLCSLHLPTACLFTNANLLSYAFSFCEWALQLLRVPVPVECGLSLVSLFKYSFLPTSSTPFLPSGVYPLFTSWW